MLSLLFTLTFGAMGELHPQSAVAVEFASAVEVNTFVDDEGRVVLRQLIVWEEYPTSVVVNGKLKRCPNAENVVAWRLLHDGTYTLDKTPRGWRIMFLDGRDGQFKSIEARRLIRSTSNYDPELKQRDLGLPRREMLTPKRRG